MTKLNDADALYLGTSVVDRVYLGTHQVWPPIIPPSGITLGASASAGYAGNQALVTLPAMTTVTGSALAVGMTRALDTGAVPSCTDNMGNAFTLLTTTPLWAQGDYGVSLDVWVCLNANGGAGHIIQGTTTYAQYPALFAQEIRGANVVLDGTMAVGRDASSPYAAAALTRTAPGAVISFLGIDSRGGPLTPACAGLTLRSDTALTNENAYYPGAMASEILDDADPFTAAWTMPGISNAPEAAIAALAFRLAP